MKAARSRFLDKRSHSIIFDDSFLSFRIQRSVPGLCACFRTALNFINPFLDIC